MASPNKSPTPCKESLGQRQQQQQQQSGRIAGTASQGGVGMGDRVAGLSTARHSGEGGGGARRWGLAAAATTVVLVSLMAAVGIL